MRIFINKYNGRVLLTITTNNNNNRDSKYQLSTNSGVALGQQVKANIIEEKGIQKEDGGTTISFTDQGGLILTEVEIQLIFWGSAWNRNPTPSSGDIITAVSNIVAGPYMSSLFQYRGIINGNIHGITQVTSSDPPNPFSDDDVANMIINLFNNGTLPDRGQNKMILYCVIVPVGISNTNGNFIGEHSYFTYNNNRVHFAWMTNNGTLDFVTEIFSHELIESCTDPEGSAILGTPGTCSQGGWCEIGDVCEGDFKRVNGIMVQSYWSQQDRACVFSIQGQHFMKTSVSKNADGRLEVLARGTDNALWHIWQTAPSNGWSGWASLGGGIFDNIVSAQNADGRLEVFARGTDNALWHIWQTAPSNGWSGWASLGGVIT
jgi:hypothetical protein